jgi:hypothetical protein
MNTADMNEILAFAIVSIESGFERVMIDPNDAVEIIDERNDLLKSLKEMCAEFRGHDLPYGSAAYANAISLINKAVSES